MTGESASSACQHATGLVPWTCSSLASPRQEENSRHVKTCCCLCCWGRSLLPGGEDGTGKGMFHQMKSSWNISHGRRQEMPKEQGLKIIFEDTGHKFKLLWINESEGTGQKGNLETQTVLDQCLELPLKFNRRPFAHQSYKRSIRVATLTPSFPQVQNISQVSFFPPILPTRLHSQTDTVKQEWILQLGHLLQNHGIT